MYVKYFKLYWDMENAGEPCQPLPEPTERAEKPLPESITVDVCGTYMVHRSNLAPE